IPVPVPLSYLLRTVYLVSPARPLDVHVVPSEPHRPAELRNLSLLWEKVNHGVGSLRVDLRAVRPLQAEGASREGDGRELEAEAQSQEWYLLLSSVIRGGNFPLTSPAPEALGDDHPVEGVEKFQLRVFPLDLLHQTLLLQRLRQKIDRRDVGIRDDVLDRDTREERYLLLRLAGEPLRPPDHNHVWL